MGGYRWIWEHLIPHPPSTSQTLRNEGDMSKTVHLLCVEGFDLGAGDERREAALELSTMSQR